MTDDADRIIGLYQRHAHDFDRERSRNLFERPWLDRFAALVGRGGSILDIGCGSGEPIARHFIESGYLLTGINSSRAMIDLCGSRSPARALRRRGHAHAASRKPPQRHPGVEQFLPYCAAMISARCLRCSVRTPHRTPPDVH